MTDDELRLEIAKAKGWNFPHEEIYTQFVTREMAMDACDMSMEGMPIPDSVWVQGDGDPPNWPADISAAWELVEEVITADYRAGIWQLKEGYNCSILKPIYLDGDEFVRCVTESQADTAPRAICEAWLAWKKVKP